MDGTRLKRLQAKLNVDSWKNINQKQFNDLVTNISDVDKETVAYIFKHIPDVADKIIQYFKDVQATMGTKHNDHLQALKEQNEMFVKLLEKVDNPATKDKIINELIEHSKWLRHEASMLTRFKMLFSLIGVGCAFMFVRLLLPKSRVMGMNCLSLGRKEVDKKSEVFDVKH